MENDRSSNRNSLLPHDSPRSRRPIKVWLTYIVSAINVLSIVILIGLYQIIITKNLPEWNAKLAKAILILLLVFDLFIVLINVCSRQILNFIQILNNLCNLVLSGLLNLGYALHWLRVIQSESYVPCVDHLNKTMTFEEYIDSRNERGPIQPECNGRMVSIIIHLQLFTTILLVTNNIGYLFYLLVMWQIGRVERIDRNSNYNGAQEGYTRHWLQEYT